MANEHSRITIKGVLEDILEQHASDRAIEVAQLKGKRLRIRLFRYAKEYHPYVIQDDAEFKINKKYGYGVSRFNMYKTLLHEVRLLREEGYDVAFFFTSHND